MNTRSSSFFSLILAGKLVFQARKIAVCDGFQAAPPELRHPIASSVLDAVDSNAIPVSLQSAI